MKVELYVEGEAATAAFADFLPKWQAARAADEKAWNRNVVADSQALTTRYAATSGATETVPAEPTGRKSGRRYGASDPDKARRTKEQIAEDKEIDELCQAMGVSEKPDIPAEHLLIQLREQSAAAASEAPAESKANISTSPEDRKDPAQEEPKAVTGEIVDDNAPTVDDVKAALNRVVEAKGMPEAIAWLKKESGYGRMSEIPAADYAKIIAAADAAIAEG